MITDRKAVSSRCQMFNGNTVRETDNIISVRLKLLAVVVDGVSGADLG